ncbi:DGQHR domain-containing protein [Shewanella algae]|uniref:DGQHR domain-containing protein n=1 Tax=Shewanella algae TaxID=38313 RepID=UPI00313C9ADC
MSNYFNEPALFVKQPFRDFYIISISAKKLVNVCYSFPAVYGNEVLNGVQRGLNDKRISNIAEFSKTSNALFPNSIIISANILPDGTAPEDDLWYIEHGNLVIPSEKKYASIVDGQHRLAGLQRALETGDIDESFYVVCAVYFELTAPEQAEVFATINFNQQKVDKSLAYQLFGYDLEATDRKYWAPDTLAIYYSRLLNKMDDSPFFGRVNFGMVKDDGHSDTDWSISTSCLVEGITSLISSNPTADRYEIHKKKVVRNERDCLEVKRNSPPLRNAYVHKKDKSIFDLILTYFKKWSRLAWQNEKTLFMRKTIGIQASFDILKELCKLYELDNVKLLEKLDEVDLEKLGRLYVNYSGIGRLQIRNELKKQLGLD